jgi:hypothetical protein
MGLKDFFYFPNPKQQKMAGGTYERTNNKKLVFAEHAYGKSPTTRRRKKC